jgi:hypothetical protein
MTLAAGEISDRYTCESKSLDVTTRCQSVYLPNMISTRL